MSYLLFLARDYIERMSNPVYGTATNEEYAIRFADLLRSEKFDARLHEEVSLLSDPTTLTSHGWLWLFGWARARNVKLDEDLLVALYEEWSSVFVRATIVDLATRRSESGIGEGWFSIGEFPHRFLSRIMSRATRTPERERTPREEEGRADWPRGEDEAPREPVPSTARAKSTLIALMQVGKPITIAAAKTLVHHEWQGQQQLIESFWALCESLDPETRNQWIERVQPPRRDL